MQNSIVEKAEEFVMTFLNKELDSKMTFHDVGHTAKVWESVRLICGKMNVTKALKEELELAALFHDCGYVSVYTGHEEESVVIASDFLKAQNYDPAKIKTVGKIILATKLDHQPKNLSEQIIRDADMNHLASKKYVSLMNNLRLERAQFLKEENTKEEWKSKNINFYQNHQYHTSGAEELFGKGKMKNLLKMTKEKKVKKVNTALASSKSAQMAFKTALRNHIDLTALADNKANIMLSVNAILITISIPYLPGYIQENPMLLIPAGILIITSIASVVTATMATRPIAMNGISKQEKIKSGSANLFFFGNFYRMKKEEYVEAISGVINDESILEKSVISDLYHLGASLGDKYKTLRLCYTIFMIGMTLTVIAAIIVYILSC